MSVQTIHFRGRGGVCENQHFFHTLLSFWPDFYYFHGDFWHSKNVDVYQRGGISESVWFIHSIKNYCVHWYTLPGGGGTPILEGGREHHCD